MLSLYNLVVGKCSGYKAIDGDQGPSRLSQCQRLLSNPMVWGSVTFAAGTLIIISIPGANPSGNATGHSEPIEISFLFETLLSLGIAVGSTAVGVAGSIFYSYQTYAFEQQIEHMSGSQGSQSKGSQFTPMTPWAKRGRNEIVHSYEVSPLKPRKLMYSDTPIKLDK